ncbi:MAG: sigma-70 family RNA polymerase sigma factor, partial [Gemmataceae bacterium]|nr:sigma-70 family RNA polymerase sigma factor [Gemmataceae bacterium]
MQTAIAFSPDGKLLATGCGQRVGEPGEVKLWDAETGKLKLVIPGAGPTVHFAPDGRTLLTSDRSVRLWDVETGKLKRTLRSSPLSDRDWEFSIGYSPDGKLIGTLRSGESGTKSYGEVNLWDAATGELKRTIKHHGHLTAGTFSPGGKTLAAGADAVGDPSPKDSSVPEGERVLIRLWDVESGEAKGSIKVPGRFSVVSLTFSPDGKKVAGASGLHPVGVWDTKTGKLEKTLGERDWAVYTVTFAPGGNYLAAGARWGKEALLVLADVDTGTRRSLRAGLGQTTAVAFSPDGRTLACRAGGTVWLWNMSKALEQQPDAANLSAFIRRLTRGMAAETLGDQSDRQLVERFLSERDEAAFEALVRRHGPMVYRVCWRVLQQDQDVEDAFQATFLMLAQKLRTVRKHASLASWLHGVAHRVALKAQAQAATRRRHERRAPLPRAVPPNEVTWRELRVILDAELARLPEKWRLPLILCYLEGRTQDEAAAQLGWSKNTLRRRLDEARETLGRRLTRRGVGPAALSAILLSDCASPAALAPGLVASAVEAAAHVAVGQAAAAVASAEVLALAEGVATTMSLTKGNIAMGLLLALGSIVTAAGISASITRPEPPAAREERRVPLRPEEPR